MRYTFNGIIFYWRGPAPHHFVQVPPDIGQELQAIAKRVSYGWGMIPAQVQIGTTTWQTSLFPKDGGYLVPIKAMAQRAEQLNVGDYVTLDLVIE